MFFSYLADRLRDHLSGLLALLLVFVLLALITATSYAMGLATAWTAITVVNVFTSAVHPMPQNDVLIGFLGFVVCILVWVVADDYKSWLQERSMDISRGTIDQSNPSEM